MTSKHGERLVVVGASLTGLRAVEAARKLSPGLPITLIGAEEHLPYDRPPLSKAFLNPEDDVDGAPVTPTFRAEAHLRDELHVDLRLGTPATALDPESGVVRCAGDTVEYSAAIIATGATPRRIPGSESLAGVHVLRSLDDARAIRAALDAGARTVVIGAGFIGSEVASAARRRGLGVTIIEALPTPLARSVGEQPGLVCAQLHRRHGTELRCGVGVSALQGDGQVEKVVLADGSVLPAQLVVVGIGVTPATGWLAGSGVNLHEGDGSVVCDETLATNVAGVYAAGDVASFPHPAFDGVRMRLEHWTNAAEQGALAARNALGAGEAQPAAAVPYFWSDWYDSRIQFVGIPAADEIRVVSAELGDDRFLALYRRGDRLTGALSIDRGGQIMKYRRLIANRESWAAALELAGV